MQWTEVDCGREIEQGKPAMSLSLPLLNIWIKHLFKRRNILHMECLAEKVINHTVFTWTNRFIVKQVKQRPLKVCFTWKVVRFLKFLHLSSLKKYSNNSAYHQYFYLAVHCFAFSKVFHWELRKFVLPYA